jgi:hypothetical protein
MSGPAPLAVPGPAILQKAVIELYDANHTAVCELTAIVTETTSPMLKLALAHVRDKLLASSATAQLYSDLKKQQK